VPLALGAARAGQTEDAETDTLVFDQPVTPRGPVQYRIVTRSTFGIYRFLGQMLVNQGDIDNSVLVADGDDRRLVTVLHNEGGNCFANVAYDDGFYCVPQSAIYTKQIVQLLAQLLALQTQVNDLAITPTVRISP
jgi:hypothetical protein